MTTAEIAAGIRASLDARYPGRGPQDYSNGAMGDNAKAYAMVLRAELFTARQGGGDLSPLGIAAGRWLILHADEDDDGVIGWGVPTAWDAYGDDSVNPANTEYTISTALVLQALLDWAERDTAAPHKKILELTTAALGPYFEGNRSPSQLAAYSLSPPDAHYDCFNPAAALAGQSQRAARLFDAAGEPQTAAACRALADDNMEVLVREHKESPQGNWYWAYSIQEPDNPSDLAHACYIVRGIEIYVEEGGTHAGQFPLELVRGHLLEFASATEFTAWPQFDKVRSSFVPRLYDIGLALQTIRPGDEGTRAVIGRLLAELPKYQRVDGNLARRPGENFVVSEYLACALAGIAIATAPTAGELTPIDSSATEFGLEGEASELERPPLSSGEWVDVPFVRWGGAGEPWTLSWNLSENHAKVHGPGVGAAPLPENLVPLAVASGGGAVTVLARPLFSNSLQAFAPGPGRAWQARPLPRPFGQHQLRSSFQDGDDWLLVTYDPVAQKNQLWDLPLGSPTAWLELQPFGELPITAHLGYVHQAALRWAKTTQGILLAGGSSLAIITPAADGGTRTVANTSLTEHYSVVEMAAKPDGVGATLLSAARAEQPHLGIPAEPFLVQSVDAAGQPVGEALAPGGVPWGLRHASDGTPQWDTLERAQLPAFIAAELSSMPGGGIHCLGIGNAEGDTVWTQTYYLAALVEILERASAERALGEVLSPLLLPLWTRLSLEMKLLDDLLASPAGLRCRTFTVDRSPALFAVQTGKLQLLLKHYQSTPSPHPLMSYGALASLNIDFDQLIEQPVTEPSPEPELAATTGYLAWPKGCAFTYDGAGLPYNHMNCWSAGLLYRPAWSRLDEETHAIAMDVAAMVPAMEWDHWPPDPITTWSYWWGRARDGWRPQQAVSVNTSDWTGDGQNPALPRYCTFDSIAVSAAWRHTTGAKLSEAPFFELLETALAAGVVEPFLLANLPEAETTLLATRVPEDPARWRIADYPDWRNLGTLLSRCPLPSPK